MVPLSPSQSAVSASRESPLRQSPLYGGIPRLHYLLHQLLDHLLADEPILLACQFGGRLRHPINDFVAARGSECGG
jgi:hypothetical protein